MSLEDEISIKFFKVIDARKELSNTLEYISDKNRKARNISILSLFFMAMLFYLLYDIVSGGFFNSHYIVYTLVLILFKIVQMILSKIRSLNTDAYYLRIDANKQMLNLKKEVSELDDLKGINHRKS